MKMEPRIIRTTVAVATLALALPALASAASLYSESFNYANGNLLYNGGWYPSSGGGAKPIQVSGNAVIVQESGGSGEDVTHIFAQQLGTAVTYASVKIKMPVGSVIGTANDYFFHFRPAAADSNNFVARTYIGPPVAGGDYTVGIAAGSLTSTPVVPYTSGFSFGAVYNLVIAYDGNTGTSTLWVNPVDQSSTSVSSTSAGLSNRLLSYISLRQASPSGATYGVVCDEIRVGTTFGDVAAPSAAPSMNEWGMILMSVAMLAAGALFVVRRRETVA